MLQTTLIFIQWASNRIVQMIKRATEKCQFIDDELAYN